jgi:hypothetical protein
VVRNIGHIALLAALFVGGAFADIPFPVAGSASGGFYDGLLGAVPLGSSVAGLTFTGATFGPTSSSTIQLGTFRLASSLAYFDPIDFRLSVNFTAPGATTATYRADLSGAVLGRGGSATVDFLSNVRRVDFGSGSFDLQITDVVVANGSSASVIGTISNATFATTPEPASALLTAGLLGALLVAFRKRLKTAKDT